MTEKQFERVIIREAKKLGFWAKHNSPDGDTGRFDLELCGPTYLWIETKHQDAKLRPTQRAWAIDYQLQGGRNLFFMNLKASKAIETALVDTAGRLHTRTDHYDIGTALRWVLTFCYWLPPMETETRN
jgi:hypothetical protein